MHHGVNKRYAVLLLAERSAQAAHDLLLLFMCQRAHPASRKVTNICLFDFAVVGQFEHKQSPRQQTKRRDLLVITRLRPYVKTDWR